MAHPLITQFEAGAGLLDLQGAHSSVDDAMVRLAAWMDLAAEQLSEDAVAVLIGVGAVLYRHGLARRIEAAGR